MNTQTTSENIIRTSLERLVILNSVSWETYENLQSDLSNQSSTRLTYDRGTLEIMSPSAKHEKYNRTIALLVEILGEGMGIDMLSLGSSTFGREDLERGFEPDSCFYIQNASLIGSKDELNLTVDPPPDLVIEVDISSGSLPKLPIYAKVGVPEVWRYDGQRLYIYQLADGDKYSETEFSGAFPWLTATVLSDFLERSKTVKRTVLIRAFRELIREQMGKGRS